MLKAFIVLPALLEIAYCTSCSSPDPSDCDADFPYLPSSCDSTKFYLCVPSDGSFNVVEMACAPCAAWTNSDAVCGDVVGGCSYTEGPTVVASTAGGCTETFVDTGEVITRTPGSASDLYTEISPSVGVYTDRQCAPGTEFNVTTCKCDAPSSTNLPDPYSGEIGCVTLDDVTSVPSWGFWDAPFWLEHEGDGVTLETDANGKSAHFNGSSSLKIGYFGNNYGRAEFSVTLWFKRDSAISNAMGVMTNGDSSVDPTLSVVSKAPDTVEMSATDVNGMPNTANTITVTPGDWHFVAIVYDDDTVTYYSDGTVQVVQKAAGANMKNTVKPLYLGVSAAGEYLTGWIDEVCFYDVALTSAQVGTAASCRDDCT